MPDWKHDLKLKAVKALLDNVDYTNYFATNKQEELKQKVDEIQDVLGTLRKH